MTALTFREWDVVELNIDDEDLPPDLTTGHQHDECDAVSAHGALCTRRARHAGRHAAGTGRRIVAVWGDPT